jgi:hypothetical protein
VAKLAPKAKPRRDGMLNLLDWICGRILIYGVLFGVGKLLPGEMAPGAGLPAVGLAPGVAIQMDPTRRDWSTVVD